MPYSPVVASGAMRTCAICESEFAPRTPAQKFCRSAEDKQILRTLYLDEELSTTDIGERFGVSSSSISSLLNKFEIEVRSISEATHLAERNEVSLSENARQYIEGLVLGDGSLIPRGDYSAMVGHSDTFGEYLEYLARKLQSFGVMPRRPNSPIYESRREGSFTDGTLYQYHSKPYPELMKMRQEWYPGGSKTIPDDFEISPNSLKNWYIGDGSPVGPSGQLKIYSRAFSKRELQPIVTQLNSIGIAANLYKRGTAGCISIKRSHADRFLDYILRDDSEIPDGYEHKFEVVGKAVTNDYPNATPTDNTHLRKGRQYKCDICGKLVWSCFGNVENHLEIHE